MPKVYITPIGRLSWPHLNQPRQFKGAGPWSYDTGLDVEGHAAQEFEQFLVQYASEYAKRVNKRSVGLDTVVKAATTKDRQSGQITTLDGVVRFQFKVNNLDGWDRKPAFFHADGSPYVEEPQIGGGSLVEIAYTIFEWKSASHGLSLVPEGIRIHELRERAATVVEHDYETLFSSRAEEQQSGKTLQFPKRGGGAASGSGANF